MKTISEEFFGLDDSGCGIPLENLGTAIQVWASTQTEATGDPATLKGAADAFHVSSDLAKKAINTHAWLFLTGPDDDPAKQIIEHEGE